MKPQVIVFGGSGFLGSAIARNMDTSGWDVKTVSAPRLTWPATKDAAHLPMTQSFASLIQTISLDLKGAQVVINAAGDPDASSRDTNALFAANTLLPPVLMAASAKAGVARFIHVSSSVVQGDQKILNSEAKYQPFSPYSLSKAMAEQRLVSERSSLELTIYRPPSVHDFDRRVTRRLARIASSPLASVAAPGTNMSPQALLTNVVSAVNFLCTAQTPTPLIVHHPWERLTTFELLEILGGKAPQLLSSRMCRSIINGLKAAENTSVGLSANRRRLELMWFGQVVDTSWLEREGWSPPVGLSGWRELANRLAKS